MSKNIENHGSKSINLIGPGTIITGDIKTNGDIRIEGKLQGNISTQGKIVIGPTGIVSGEINCKNSEISGKVDGKIVVAELLSLKSSAIINGDIITNKLAIEPDAKFTGTCDMNQNINKAFETFKNEKFKSTGKEKKSEKNSP